MPSGSVRPPFDRFLASAQAVARERPEADLEMAREVFLDAATLLGDGLATEAGDLHDPEGVSAAHLLAAAIVQL